MRHGVFCMHGALCIQHSELFPCYTMLATLQCEDTDYHYLQANTEVSPASCTLVCALGFSVQPPGADRLTA